MLSREAPSYAAVADDVQLGENVKLAPFVNLYGCAIGDDSRVGAFVEIQRGARIGRRCKISSHSFICTGAVIEDEVFIGHGVMFINDRHPRAASPEGVPLKEGEWLLESVIVRRGASVGTGAIIMCGTEIGEGAIVGAGAVVLHDIPAKAVAVGHPARVRGK